MERAQPSPRLSDYSLGRVVVAVAVTAVAMLVADVVWLRLRGAMYRASIAAVQNGPLRLRAGWGAAAYALMAASIPLVAFPAAGAVGGKQINPASAAVSGAFLGLAVYGVFNATNAAIFSRYPVRMALQDTLWGTALFSAASALFAALVV